MGYRRVVLSGENSEPKYSNYLCFVVSVQTNKLMSEYGGKYGGIADPGGTATSFLPFGDGSRLYNFFAPMDTIVRWEH